MPIPGISKTLSDITGFFNGAATDRLFIPFNDLIKTYNLDVNSLFRVKLSAFSTYFPMVDKEGVNKGPSDPNAIWENELLYNEESVRVNHSHNYGTVGGLPGFVVENFNKGALGFSGTDVVRAVQAFDDMMNSTRTMSEIQSSVSPFRTAWNDFSSLDTAKAYQGSSKPQTFTASFYLMASRNPLFEVVIPATVFAYLSYPTINPSKRVNILKQLANAASNLGSGERSENYLKELANSLKNRDVEGTGKGILDGMALVVSETIDFIKDVTQGTYGDKWRYRIGDPPPYWTVSSSNGIIHMNNAHISDIDITYFGPWLKNTSSNAGGEVIRLLKGANINPQTMIGDVLQSSNSVGRSGFDTGSLLNAISEGDTDELSGFPSYAEVKVTFESNFNQVFGEEILMAIVGANNHFGGKVTTSAKTAIVDRVINPSPNVIA